MSDTHQLVARLAVRYLLKFDQDHQLSDHAMTAWQFGAMALVALGVAEERAYGCDLTVEPDEVPDRIDPAGLWTGDALLVLIRMASQAGDLRWDKPQRRLAGQVEVRPVGGWEAYRENLKTAQVPEEMPEPMRSNMRKVLEMQKDQIHREDAQIAVAPLPGGYPSRVAPDIHAVLVSNGWVAKGQWQPAAQVALWRSGDLPVPEAEAARISMQAQEGLPDDVARAIEAVWAPPDMGDIERRAKEWHARAEEMRAGLPVAVRKNIRGPQTLDEMCEVLLRRWPDDATGIVNGHVQDRWRAELGWDNGAALLPLFHDRVAAQVTKALVEA